MKLNLPVCFTCNSLVPRPSLQLQGPCWLIQRFGPFLPLEPQNTDEAMIFQEHSIYLPMAELATLLPSLKKQQTWLELVLVLNKKKSPLCGRANSMFDFCEMSFCMLSKQVNKVLH